MVMRAVEEVTSEGRVLTADLGGTASTSEMVKAIEAKLAS